MPFKEQNQERLRSVQDWPTFLRVHEVVKYKMESCVCLWKLLRKSFFIENGKEQFFRMLDML